MEEPLTISKEAPAQKSMNYELLREEALKYIQNIAGKVWTDYNTHDPGVTILEVLCYAITDLGYRTSYDIKDLIAPNPDDKTGQELYNFFTAAQILPNAPVTTNDYRKLMIDVEVHDPDDPGCKYAGVKNAWIEKAPEPKQDIFVNKKESKLVYRPVTSGDKPLDLKILHNILLEFDECDTYGDLNENKIIRDLTIELPEPDGSEDPDPELDGLVIRVDVEFPRWDDDVVAWQDDDSLVQGIHGIELSFLNLPGNFEITHEITPTNEVVLSGTKTSPSGPVNIEGLNAVTLQINEFISDTEDGLIKYYRDKIAKIMEIVNEVKATLHANRNLCEDFLQFNALRIEEILVCADIELELDANVEDTQARLYHEISKFLSPTVYFYTLDEMMTRCFDEYQYDVVAINAEQRIFTVDATLDPMPDPDTIISITGSNNNNGTYTVQQAQVNREDESRTDITVQEAIPSDILTEDNQLYLANLEEDQCIPTEEIFEGPLLNHGFIDNNELALADRKKVIHVSDLIQIIMDVPGVVAVKNIQIANVPQDDKAGTIESKSVKWCLKLAFNQNYVPRLNTDDSRITFFKNQLPFQANQLEVDKIINKLKQDERPQKRRNPVMDIKPPLGEYRDVETYYSIQNEFPLVYGIGEEGVPTRSQDTLNLPTEANAKQLKGYLLHFDQLLANYLSQLAHVKDLFSMNSQKDKFGNFVIGRTYHTQPLFDIAPNSDALYIDSAGHRVALNDIAETEELFWERRNRFLDHLMARFAEQFTDYAMLTYRISGPKAQNELIEDKLAFLNSYPELSRRRGTAMNCQEPCQLWHKDNVSGLEQRSSLLVGIGERKISELQFRPRFKITGSTPNIEFFIENNVPEDVLKSPAPFETINKAKEALEEVILNGVHRHKFVIQTDDETNYYFQLLCDDRVIAKSVKTDFTPDEGADDPLHEINTAIEEVFDLLQDEFYENPESNRHNLACPLHNYLDNSILVNMETDPPTFTISYALYQEPFDFSGADPILTGSYTGEGAPKLEATVTNIDKGTFTFTVEGDITANLVEDDFVVIEGSDYNNDSYTMDSFSLNGDGNTEIVVNESISPDIAPFGKLHYNQVTHEEMQAMGEAAIHDVLWQFVANGVRRSRYSFDPAVPPYIAEEPDPPIEYRFQIRDFRGNLLGQSTEFNFNEWLAKEIANLSSGTVTVIEPGEKPKEYEYSLDQSEKLTSIVGNNINVHLTSIPYPIPNSDWNLEIKDSFPLKGIDAAGQEFTVEGDFSSRLVKGNTITLTDHPSSNGKYTIVSTTFDGKDTLIKVKEEISSEDVDGILSYSKIFPIIRTGRNVVTFKGEEDDASNEALVKEIVGISNQTIILLEPGDKPDEYEYSLSLKPEEAPVAAGPNIKVSLEFPPSPTPGLDWHLEIKDSFLLKNIDNENQLFIVESDLSNKLTEGNAITITDHFSNNGNYTILSVIFDGTDSAVKVEEEIPSQEQSEGQEGILTYAKLFPIQKVAGNLITIKGGADEAAVEAMIAIITSRFFDHEGMHLIEHILLRPRTNEPLFLDADEVTLTEGMANLGTLHFTKQYPLFSANQASQTLLVEGDITADLANGMTITIRDTPLTNGNFTVDSFTYADPHTKITVEEVLIADVEESSGGVLTYSLKESISAISAGNRQITFAGNHAADIGPDSILEITGSTNAQNDGRYTMLSATDAGNDTEITIEKVELLVQDRLLPVNLDEECACKLEDPYTCMARVVLPYWPGRFTNNDFRQFFERTLQREAPAHVFLEICWVSCRHMAEFERVYKAWLIENARPENDNVTLSKTLHELIDSIEQLRNVYPEGRLHDCAEDEDLENAIILNNSVLGEI